MQSSTLSGTTLKYQFPPPSKEIIENVAKSLLDVPELYQNVLNIMNKMGLPPPFVEKSASQFSDASSSKMFANGLNTCTQPIAPVSVDEGKGVDRATKAFTSSPLPKATVSAVSPSKAGPAKASAKTNSSSNSAKTKARIAELSLKDQQKKNNAAVTSSLTAPKATASTSKASAITGTKFTATTTCSKGQRKRRKQKEKRAAEIIRKLTFGINRVITSPLLSGKPLAFAVADTMNTQLPLGLSGQALGGMKRQQELLIQDSFLNENFVSEAAANLQRELTKHKSAMAAVMTPKERTDANILMNNTERMLAYNEYNVSQMAEFLKVKSSAKERLIVKEQASTADETVDAAKSTSSASSAPVVATTWNRENIGTTTSALPNPKLVSIDTALSSPPPTAEIKGNADAVTLCLLSFAASSIDIASSAPIVEPSRPPLPPKLTTPTKPILRTVSQFESAVLPSEPYIFVPSLATNLSLKRKADVLSPSSAPDSKVAQNVTTFREVSKNEDDPDYVLSSNKSGGESEPEPNSESGSGLEIESESQPEDHTDAEAVNRAKPRQRLSRGVKKMDTDERSATDEAEEIKAIDVAKGNMAADAAEKIKAAISAKGVMAADLAMVLKSVDTIPEETFNAIEPLLEQMTKKQQTEIRQILKDHEKDKKKAFWLEVNDPVVPVPLAVIDSNRVPQGELFTNSKLRFVKSEPSSTLYINNLSAKRVRAQDLANIFSNFFDPPQDIEVKGTIRYMNAGRMKGRAYIYFPSVEKAKKAYERVNGYILHGQPMVIMYGNQPQNTQKNVHNASEQAMDMEKRQTSGNGDVTAKIKGAQMEAIVKK
ncbi:RNA-binding region-containing protein 3 [Haplosporangium sp. Z 11]|nr:RNA-binding region-containing protein 3 [Haplosporangium sp. Z 11]